MTESKKNDVVETVAATTKPQRFSFTEEEKARRNKILCETLRKMAAGLLGQIPEYPVTRGAAKPPGPDFVVDVGREDLIVTLKLQDDAHAGMMVGPNHCNMLGLLNFLRMQQILPHNKIVTIFMEFPSGKIQAFKDSNLFNRPGCANDDFYKINRLAPPHVRPNRPQQKVNPLPAQDQQARRGAKLRKASDT